MSLTFENILEDVALVLIEQNVQTVLGTTISAGVQTVTPGSMVGVYLGALLLVGSGASQEVVTVSAVTATTFTATFSFGHMSTDPLVGATFPSGQTDAPLFTQLEMIAYLTDVQNDFLLKTRILYAIATQNTKAGQRVYAQPATAIRLERIAIPTGSISEGYGTGPYGEFPYGGGTSTAGNMTDLYETSQSNLDLMDPLWSQRQDIPQQFFRDQIDTAMFGLFPIPSAIFLLEQWYSVRGVTSGNTLNTLLLVPDIFGHYMKYGTLARCFSKDGEMRDPKRADYCKKRYDLGVLLALKFMTGAGVSMDKGTNGDPSFSPMPVPART
jgi:hypothetical protein